MYRLDSYFLVILSLAVIFSIFSFQSYPAYGGTGSDGLQEINTLFDADEIVIEAVVQDPGSEILKSSENGQDIVMLDGFRLSGSPGDPLLPVRTFSFLMPPEADLSRLSVSVQHPRYRLLEREFDILPAPPDMYREGDQDIISWGGKSPSDIENGRDLTIYKSNNFFPNEVITIAGGGRLRELQIVKITLYFARYNPVEKKVEMLTDGVIQVKAPVFSVPARARSKKVFNGPALQLDQQLQSLANPDDVAEFYGYDSDDQLTLQSSVADPTKIVIITTEEIVNNSNALPNYISYKRSRGYEVRLVTEGLLEDDDHYLAANNPEQRALNIRSWLQARVDELHTALLIGDPRAEPLKDSISVPMMYCYPYNDEGHVVPTDMFYADLSGTWDLDGDGYYGEYFGDRDMGGLGPDEFAELDIGRIPFYGNYEVMDAILNRFISFEDIYVDDIGYRDSVLISAAILWLTPPEFVTYGDLWGEEIKRLANLAGKSAFTLYEKDGYDFPTTACDVPLTQTNFVNEWQKGYGVVTITGHGSAGSIVRTIWANDFVPYDVFDPVTEVSEIPFFEYFDIASLNDAYPGFSVHLSCSNGVPEEPYNLGAVLLENWGVGTIVATRTSWGKRGPWDSSMLQNGLNRDIGIRIYNLIAQDNTLAHALSITRSETDYIEGGSGAWINATAFNLYGDPTLKLSSSRQLYYPRLTLISPNGYEDYFIGQIIPVTWNSMDISGDVAIDISRDGGINWSTIISGTVNDGHENISLTGPESDHCRIRVRANDGSSAEDISNYDFRVSTPPPPDTPTGLVASDGAFTDRVRLTWIPVPYATVYQVYRRQEGGTFFINLGLSLSASYDDSTVSSGVTYEYYVVAVNGVGDTSGSSETDTGYVAVTLTLPSIPTGVNASDGTFADKVHVSWDSSDGASQYIIERALIYGGFLVYEQIGTSIATYYDDMSAEQGNEYSYRVIATNFVFESGVSSADSGFVTLVINLPATPTGLTASDGEFTEKVELNWDVSANASGYQVYRAPVTDDLAIYQIIGNTTSTTFDDTGVTPGKYYSYKVRSYTTHFESDLSLPNTGFAAGALPGIPAELTASDGIFSDHISVSWQPAENALYYSVYRGVDTGEGAVLYMEVDDTAGTSLEDYDVLPDTLYSYKVKAVNQFGDSLFSSTDTGYLKKQVNTLPAIMLLLLEE